MGYNEEIKEVSKIMNKLDTGTVDAGNTKATNKPDGTLSGDENIGAVKKPKPDTDGWNPAY